jgi:hypothetical protein
MPRISPEDFPSHSPSTTLYSVASSVGPAYLARSKDAHSSFIVPLRAPVHALASDLYGRVRLRFFDDLELRGPGMDHCTPAAAVECLDEALLLTFCSLCTDILDRCEPPIDGRAVLEVVRDWRTLLRPGRILGPEAELGLWGELRFILEIPNIPAAIETWHGPGGAPIDFVGGGIAVECKTTQDEHRHTVSLDQLLWSSKEGATYLASIIVQDDPASGSTISELVATISARLSNRTAFERRLFRSGYRLELSSAYTHRIALSSLRLYLMDDLPRVRQIDAGVTNVRFEIDFANLGKTPLSGTQTKSILGRLGGVGI